MLVRTRAPRMLSLTLLAVGWVFSFMKSAEAQGAPGPAPVPGAAPAPGASPGSAPSSGPSSAPSGGPAPVPGSGSAPSSAPATGSASAPGSAPTPGSAPATAPGSLQNPTAADLVPPPSTTALPPPPPPLSAGGYLYPPAPPPDGWGAVEDPAPEPKEPKQTRVTKTGLPVGERGFIGLDTASYTFGSGAFSGVAADLVANVPLTGRTFIDVRLPIGLTITRDINISDRTLATLGNIQLGAHHILRYGKRAWVSLGGAVGLPTLSSRGQGQDNYEAPAAGRAYWGLEEFFPDTLPFSGHFSGEIHAGPMLLRGELSLSILTPISNRNDSTEIMIPHAIEVQFGHFIGGGLRLQGVWLPTFDQLDVHHTTEGDLYQFALEPFFVVERKIASLRVGIMMPIDEQLGPPFDKAWGFRLATGVRLE